MKSGKLKKWLVVVPCYDEIRFCNNHEEVEQAIMEYVQSYSSLPDDEILVFAPNSNSTFTLGLFFDEIGGGF